MDPEYWVVRRCDGAWECRHVPAGSGFFDNDPQWFPSAADAFAGVPVEFTQAIGPADAGDGGASFYRPGDWEKVLGAGCIDPATWYEQNAGHHWVRAAA